MKKIILAIFSILFISNFSNAQLNPKKLFLGGYAGAQMYTTGSYNSFIFGAEFGNNANKDVSFLGNAGAIIESSNKRYEITFNMRAYMGNETTVKFFGELGAGPYIFKSSYSSTSYSDTYMGVNFGLGGSLKFDDETNLIIKGKFHNIFPAGGGGNWVNLTVGVNFDMK
jgi:hypothetical protein